MALGRKTGGRQKGTPNKKTKEMVEAISRDGITPLEYMLSVMRDETAERSERMDMAKAAAPYIHPKLSSIEVGGDPDNPVNHKVEFVTVYEGKGDDGR